MFQHTSVLLNESIEGLNIKKDGKYVDTTLGAGGHSSQILKRLTTGHLYCFDQDQDAIHAATDKLKQISDNFTIINSNFRNLKEELKKRDVENVDGILFDLGVSSYQFDEVSRGFSYNHEARLDMRMDVRNTLSAYEIVNEWKYQDIVSILYRYADEKFAKNIAHKIEKTRENKPITTTFELVEVIKSALPASVLRKKGHPAKKTFQALRIAVNDELHVFEIALKDALDILKPNARIAVITFHSLEDRICKQLFKEVSTIPAIPKGIPYIPKELEPKFKLVNKKPIIASEEELLNNHRSHSAKLRIIERIEHHEQ